MESSSRLSSHAVLGLAFLLLAGVAFAEPVKIDVGMSTGRRDTAAPGWEEWQVANGPHVHRAFGGLQFELRAMGATQLTGAWHKAGLATGATMATDGIVAEALELTIHGLSPGEHHLATWHNSVLNVPVAPMQLMVQGGETATVEASHRVASDHSAGVAYVSFVVGEDRVARFRLKPANEGDGAGVVLNGLELDGGHPQRRALNPLPRSEDWHVDGDSGEVLLRWEGAKEAVSYRVFFARAASAAHASVLVGQAESGDFLQAASVVEPMQRVKVDAFNSQLHYAWRVDTVERDGRITRGEVWTFRIRQLAFPGAEGYGRFAIGGRGGNVYSVTNLNDSGPGSLRDAVEADGPRTVVFDVSGRIVLKSRLVIRNPFLTIAGHTAPGKGVCISNYNLGMLGTHDIVIRHLRVRPGDRAGKTLDGMGMASTDHAIIDHCSISWTQDEAFSSRGAKHITLQRTLISEALNIAGHKKYAEGTQHGYAASISGDIGSFHHNLLAHCAGRNWSLAGGLDQAGVHAGRLDIRNNVVYNWSHRTTDGGAKEVNFVNNYYKPGPATRVFHVLKPERNPGFGPQSYFVEGNVMVGHYGAEDPLRGVVRTSDEPLGNYIVDEPFFPAHVATVTAEEAYRDVLGDVGATVPVLDEHDQRVIHETIHGTARFFGSRSGLPGLPDSQEDVGGWEHYPVQIRPSGWDVDGDGIPGIWEDRFGFNAMDPTDGAADTDGDGYTTLETYLHWLAAGNRLEPLTTTAIQEQANGFVQE